jgi:hypothetical protein
MENTTGSLDDGEGGRVQRTAATKMTTPMPPGPDGAVRTISPSKRQLQPDGGPRTSRQTTSPEKREGLAPPTRGRAAATSIGGGHIGRRHGGRGRSRQAGEGRRQGGADLSGGAAADGREQSAGAVNEFGGEGAQMAREGEESRPPSR